MILKTIISCLFLLVALDAMAQSRFTGMYRSYELPQSPRIAGLGGKSIAISDNDISLSFNNPSLLKEGMSNVFFIQTTSYGAGVKYGNFLYSHTFKERGNIAVGVQMLDYGTFRRMDEFGYELGEFTGNDFVFYFIWSKELFKNIHLGATAKPIYSKIDTYTSYGAAFDFGIHYLNPTIGTTFSVVVNNLGKQFKPYVEGSIEDIPYDVQAGFSTKLKHAPFRFSLMFYNLTHKSLLYTNQNVSEPNNTGMPPEAIEKDYIYDGLENVLRHSIFGVELIPSRAFYLQFGYNFLRRSELKTISRPSISGVSVGLGVKYKGVTINYARAQYHLSQVANHISLQINLTNLLDF